MPININANNSVYEVFETVADGDLPKAYHLMYEHLEGKISYEKCVALVDTINGYSIPKKEKKEYPQYLSDVVYSVYFGTTPYSMSGMSPEDYLAKMSGLPENTAHYCILVLREFFRTNGYGYGMGVPTNFLQNTIRQELLNMKGRWNVFFR